MTARCKGLLAAWAFLQAVKLQKNSSRCFAKKYSLTRTDPFISDDVCCYSQTRFKRMQNCSINWGKLVALITVHFQAPSKNVYRLANLAWKQVVFLANNFFTSPVGGVALVLRRLISHKTIRRLRNINHFDAMPPSLYAFWYTIIVLFNLKIFKCQIVNFSALN